MKSCISCKSIRQHSVDFYCDSSRNENCTGIWNISSEVNFVHGVLFGIALFSWHIYPGYSGPGSFILAPDSGIKLVKQQRWWSYC